MSTAKLHPSLPAPVVHAGFSAPQSKSHVLAGVQDAYWSDDEAEDAECPLCLEEMDISDLNFKPCVCGYQICRFCWHHIKENLNKRCPACRRVYTDEAVEFKPINTQDHKRLMQQKKQRERERKELDALGRRHLANVRVVQRNVVYVIGIGPRFAKEELIPTLRSNEYFGQYGKITKIVLVKRTPSGGGEPVVGLYITYYRREDAARAIAAVDGVQSPGGGKEIMRASHGTTKYCMAFLRGVSCTDQGCMNLHEWGDEKDCFTKEDLTTLKHTMKATESRTRTTIIKRSDEPEAGLPRAASWAQKQSGVQSAMGISGSVTTSSLSRPTRRSGAPRSSRVPLSITQMADSRSSQRSGTERKPLPSVSHSASRPSSPQTTISEGKARRETMRPKSTNSPAPSAVSDTSSLAQDRSAHVPSRPSSPASTQSPMPSMVTVANSIPAVPPGLSAPPGIPSPGRPPRTGTDSPQTPLLSSQSSYQMSTAARELLNDVKTRREAPLPAVGYSPFPDFDRTLETLSAKDGGFSFNFDPKLAGEIDTAESLNQFEADANIPFSGSFMDAFPALRHPNTIDTAHIRPPPGLGIPPIPSTNRPIYDPYSSKPDMERQTSHGYIGSFNPFADSTEEDARGSFSRTTGDIDDERKFSRFNFARARQNPALAPSLSHSTPSTSVASPSRPSPLTYSPANGFSSNPQHWSPVTHSEYTYSQPVSTLGSPMLQQTQPQPAFTQSTPGFQPFEADLSEARLREFIQNSRERANANNLHIGHQEPPGLNKPQQPFQDPAIMSASFGPTSAASINHFTYGPPPGLVFPQSLNSDGVMVNSHVSPIHTLDEGSTHVSTTTSPALSAALSSSDFPALVASVPGISDTPTPAADEDVLSIEATKSKLQEKAERKAAKKAAAAERAAERQRIAQEKAAAKAAEKAELARKKAEEKERLLQEQAAEAERKKSEELMKIEQENATRAEREAAEKARAEKERERAARAERERAKKALKQTSITKPQPKSKDPPATPSTPSTPVKTAADDFAVPLLSKKPRKNKPVTKPIRVPREEEHLHDETSTLLSAATSEAPRFSGQTANSSRANSRAHSVERQTSRATLIDLFEQIHAMNPHMDLTNHPFFDLYRVASASKMPLEYGPLVHALSALSVGGGSFANNVPSHSIDNAVSSFQQLLETLTQTISDLLRLLPRTTWDDSSSFDGVLRDMLKSDDFLEEAGEDNGGKEDEVAALTLALERRARWMEVQLSKLEELHRDINTAAVRAILALNDSGWDRFEFLPRITNTLRRFSQIGMVDEDGKLRPMSTDELEKKLVVSKEATVFAETEVREMMEKFQGIKFETPY